MKNNIVRIVVFSLIALISIESAGAQDVSILDIGNGFRCSGTSILNRTDKIVKLGNAKSKIQNKIDAVVGTSAKAKAKRKALKTTKSNLTKCSTGQLTSSTPGGENPGGEAPGDNLAVLGAYTGTLTRVSINDAKGGCADSATPSWRFTVRVSTIAPGKVFVSAVSPFQGGYQGGATTSGFKFIASDLSILRGAETFTLVGSNVTDTSATITITEKHERLVSEKGVREPVRVFACESTYTGAFARDKDAL